MEIDLIGQREDLVLACVVNGTNPNRIYDALRAKYPGTQWRLAREGEADFVSQPCASNTRTRMDYMYVRDYEKENEMPNDSRDTKNIETIVAESERKAKEAALRASLVQQDILRDKPVTLLSELYGSSSNIPYGKTACYITNPPQKKIHFIRYVRQIFTIGDGSDIGLRDAKEFVEGTRALVFSDDQWIAMSVVMSAVDDGVRYVYVTSTAAPF